MKLKSNKAFSKARRVLIVTALGTSFIAGCSTIDRGVIDYARVDSVPQGAKVTATYIQGAGQPSQAKITRVTCRATPCAIPLSRRQYAKITIEADGYEPASYMVGSSRLRGNANISLAKTVPSAAAVGAGTGIVYAGMTQAIATLANALTFNLGQAQGTSTVAGASAGTGVGLAFAAGSLLIDVGTGANANLFPNPVVIGLTDDAEMPALDPFVAQFDALIVDVENIGAACVREEDIEVTCNEARVIFSKAYKTYRSAVKEREQRLIELAKTQKQQLEEVEAQP